MENIKNLTTAELEELLAQKKEEDRQVADQRRKAYESLRADFAKRVHNRVNDVAAVVKDFATMITSEAGAFRSIMEDYGAVRRNSQMGYTIQTDTFKLEVKSNKVKRFDERADTAASRLIEFLKAWIAGRDKGSDDPMYQLAMTMLERNKYGDLDYKSISKLYDLEAQFGDPEYSAIMQLFKESNVVEATATNYYFSERDQDGVWHKIEPSFNRM